MTARKTNCISRRQEGKKVNSAVNHLRFEFCQNHYRVYSAGVDLFFALFFFLVCVSRVVGNGGGVTM